MINFRATVDRTRCRTLLHIIEVWVRVIYKTIISMDYCWLHWGPRLNKSVTVYPWCIVGSFSDISVPTVEPGSPTWKWNNKKAARNSRKPLYGYVARISTLRMYVRFRPHCAIVRCRMSSPPIQPPDSLVDYRLTLKNHPGRRESGQCVSLSSWTWTLSDSFRFNYCISCLLF